MQKQRNAVTPCSVFTDKLIVRTEIKFYLLQFKYFFVRHILQHFTYKLRFFLF